MDEAPGRVRQGRGREIEHMLCREVTERVEQLRALLVVLRVGPGDLR